MKWIILSDIHANLPALDAVLEDIEKRFPGILSDKNHYNARIVSLGDQIGYHPYPNEVMDRIWDLADEILIGNHDEGIYVNKDIRNLKAFVGWCRKNRYVNGDLTLKLLKEPEKPVKSLNSD